jgi:two-component system cell cycle sensor histidine kinase/response regulator CckA
MDKLPTQPEQALRQRAERLLDADYEKEFVSSPSLEAKQLVHELLVHQVELEMQNEELRSAHEQLDVSQVRYFDLYDLAPIGYLTLNDRRLIQECNLFAAKIMGVDRNILLKAPISQILLGEDQNIFYENLKKSVELAVPLHFEMRLMRANGDIFWGLLQVIAIKASEYWITVTDISQNKQVEAELQESHHKFRSIFEQAAVGVARLGLDGAWLEVNTKLCAIVGYSQQVLLGKSFQDLIHPEDLQMVQAAINQLLNNEIRTYSREKRYYNQEGNIVWVNLTMNLVRDIHNEPDYFISIMEDITSQKNEAAKQLSLTKQLQQAQKMEAIGHLAGGIAHDFNNMLGVILGQTELVMKKLDPINPLIKNLQAVCEAASHSAKLTSQILTYARKQMIEPKVLDLNSSVSAMMDMLKRLIGKNIYMSWDQVEELWPIKVDPTQVDQIIVNLSINARDAISGNGKISISTSNCTLDQQYVASQNFKIEPGDYVKLSVSDDGCGMNDETLTHIFDPFFTTKPLVSSTGLGLSFTYGAVKMNGGFINVCSQVGHGTTFDIYFQRVKAFEVSPKKVTGAIDAIISPVIETILLVEDEEMLLEIGTAMLENSGYNVLAASDGVMAEALLRKHSSKIDLLVTDIIMPEINGRDLAIKFKTLYPDLKVLFMSGYTDDVLEEQFNLKEGTHFLQKPFSMKALTTKVREALNDK